MMFTTAAACLALAIYHEARGEPNDGQLWVAEVIVNRVEHPDYPDTVCGVVTQHNTPASRPRACQFSFFCDGASDKPREGPAWEKSKRIAKQTLEGTVLGTKATHFHTKAVSPAWAKRLTMVGSVGSHVFYTDGKLDK
jgi:spore germination cell wall hydrolase CwlJ-like protein